MRCYATIIPIIWTALNIIISQMILHNLRNEKDLILYQNP